MIHCRGLRRPLVLVLHWFGSSHLSGMKQTENHVLVRGSLWTFVMHPFCFRVLSSRCPDWFLLLLRRAGFIFILQDCKVGPGCPAQQACGSCSAYCFDYPFCVGSLILVLDLTVSFQACVLSAPAVCGAVLVHQSAYSVLSDRRRSSTYPLKIPSTPAQSLPCTVHIVIMVIFVLCIRGNILGLT